MKARQHSDAACMRLALRLAQRAYGCTSPNPLVGAVLVKSGRVIGRGWHHRAGAPHAEIEALRDATQRGQDARGATLYVTLEPCCTHGRTPPCTDAIIAVGIRRVVVAATDPNPAHAGRGFELLRRAGLEVESGLRAAEAARLNESFNHWIVERTPFVTVKAAMTLDGKIATADGESKWITGEESRAHALHLRRGVDAILVGVNTVLADDPSLTARAATSGTTDTEPGCGCGPPLKPLRRLVLDSRARTPLGAKLVTDGEAARTTIFVAEDAPVRRVATLARRVAVVAAPVRGARLDLRWILRRLGREGITSLLVEGGGEVNAAFLEASLVHRIAFFFAPKVLGGRRSRKGVAGEGFADPREICRLRDLEWCRLGDDLHLTARVAA